MISTTHFIAWSMWIFILIRTGHSQCRGTPLEITMDSSPYAVSSPGYGNSDYLSGTDCSWIISTVPEDVILYSLFINDTDCRGDSIEIFYGPGRIFVENTGSTCGKNLTFGPFSDNPDDVMTVVFRSSDTSKGGAGFIIHMLSVPRYTSTICFEYPLLLFAVEDFSFITSENFPADYGGNLTCEWRIASSNQSRDIILEILFLDIENGEDCSLDYLQVKNEQSSTIRRFCGSNDFVVKRFKASEFSLTFHSDDSVQQKGFIVRYRLDNATKEDCSNRTADIIFMVDTTEDTKMSGFNHQLMIVQDVISAYDVSKNGVRFGTVIYEDGPFSLYWLDEHSNTADVLNLTSAMPYVEGYGRDIHGTLEFVRNESFCTCHGARESSVKLIVIFMFGESDDYEKTTKITKALHNEGVHVISIGIGSIVNATEMEAVASEIENVFFFENIEYLADFSYVLSERICEILDSKSRDFPSSTYVLNSNLETSSIIQSSEVQKSSQTRHHTIAPTSVSQSIFFTQFDTISYNSKSSLSTSLDGSVSSTYASDITSESKSSVGTTSTHISEVNTISISTSVTDMTYLKSSTRRITPYITSSSSLSFASSMLVTSVEISPSSSYTDTSTSPSTLIMSLSEEEKLTTTIAVAFVPSAVSVFVILTLVTCIIAKLCNRCKQVNKCHVKNMEEISHKKEPPDWIEMAGNFQISERAKLKLKSDV